MIVVDTNIIAYLYLQGEHTAQAEKVLQKDSEWMAPPLWRSEFRNVLAFYLRQGHLLLDDAQAIMWEAELLLQVGSMASPQRGCSTSQRLHDVLPTTVSLSSSRRFGRAAGDCRQEGTCGISRDGGVYGCLHLGDW